MQLNEIANYIHIITHLDISYMENDPLIMHITSERYLIAFAERALMTFNIIGPAVFNGGLSTFLAFVLLGFSQAYVFIAFFKV